MPLYEYKCLKCGYSLEIIQHLNDKPEKKCVNCGGPVKKVISAPALQFKGDGWYITDYAKNKKPEKKEKPKSEEKTLPMKNQKTPDPE